MLSKYPVEIVDTREPLTLREGVKLMAAVLSEAVLTIPGLLGVQDVQTRLHHAITREVEDLNLVCSFEPKPRVHGYIVVSVHLTGVDRSGYNQGRLTGFYTFAISVGWSQFSGPVKEAENQMFLQEQLVMLADTLEEMARSMGPLFKLFAVPTVQG